MTPILDRVAETGDLSMAEELQSYIEEDLAETDPAISEELMKDYEELMTLSGADEIKAKCEEMKAKL
jgi:hypothetical protein